MALQARGHAQMPLIPEVPPPIPTIPSQAASVTASSSTVHFGASHRTVIEVPGSPSLGEGTAKIDHKPIHGADDGKVCSQRPTPHNNATAVDDERSPTSTIKRLVSSIRTNLQEVVSVLRNYPAPTKSFKLAIGRGGGREEDQVLEYHGNKGEWPCRWLGACGTVKWQAKIPPVSGFRYEDDLYLYDTGDFAKSSPDHWSNDSRVVSDIPEYVFEYAPLVHLFSGEQFWPCDMGEHLDHVTPNLNYTPVLSRSQNLNLTNLDDLNEFNGGRFVYLKSDDNVEERPDWLGGQKNVPNVTVHHPKPKHPYSDPRKSQEKPSRGGRSDAPAVLIVVNKGHGIVDAFWFYFYSYNLGNIVLNVRFGNHVGDWEHSLVRFQHGKPKLMFFSEHFFGEAYTYDAVEKIGKRPVVYSAIGTHAMYATPGLHPYILPLGLLHDQTDRGPLWDPLLNTLSYTYALTTKALTPSNHTPHAPTNWFFYNGHWGDKLYPMDDSRQYQFAGQHHYVSGPLGPRWKNLGRRKVCQGRYSDRCVVRHWLGGEGVKVWPGGDEDVGVEEMEGLVDGGWEKGMTGYD